MNTPAKTASHWDAFERACTAMTQHKERMTIEKDSDDYIGGLVTKRLKEMKNSPRLKKKTIEAIVNLLYQEQDENYW